LEECSWTYIFPKKRRVAPPSPLLDISFSMEAGDEKEKIMELDVSRIRAIPVQKFSRENVEQLRVKQQKSEQKQQKAIDEIAQDMQRLRDKIDSEKYLQEVLNLPSFNKRIKFQVDNDQVFVKVIDGETDKVIKEIPQEELRTMYQRIHEYIGVFIDEQI
jgi:flagellar protein FlaG